MQNLVGAEAEEVPRSNIEIGNVSPIEEVIEDPDRVIGRGNGAPPGPDARDRCDLS
jgi:hypothetical protein